MLCSRRWASIVGRAVRAAVAKGARTADIAGPGDKPVGCEAMGEAVLAALG